MRKNKLVLDVNYFMPILINICSHIKQRPKILLHVGNYFRYECFTDLILPVSVSCNLLFLYLTSVNLFSHSFFYLSVCLFFSHYPLLSNSLVYLIQAGIIPMRFSILLHFPQLVESGGPYTESKRERNRTL